MENDYSIKVKIANRDITTYSNHNSSNALIVALEDDPRANKKALKGIKREIKKKVYYSPYRASCSFLENIFKKMRFSDSIVRLYSPYEQVNYAPGNAHEVKLFVKNALLDKQISFIYRDVKGRETLRLVTPVAIYEKYFVGKSGDIYRNYKFEKVRYFWFNSGNKSPLALYKLKNDVKTVTSNSSNLTYSFEKVDNYFLRTVADYSSETDAYFLSDDLFENSDNYDDLFLTFDDPDPVLREKVARKSFQQAKEEIYDASEAYEVIRRDYAALEKEYKDIAKNIKKEIFDDDLFSW